MEAEVIKDYFDRHPDHNELFENGGKIFLSKSGAESYGKTVTVTHVRGVLCETDAKGNDEGNDDQGNDDQGNDDQGNDDQGNDDQGNDDQGNDDQGNDDQGNDDQGNDDQGNDDQGNDDQGNDARKDYRSMEYAQLVAECSAQGIAPTDKKKETLIAALEAAQ